MRRAEVLLAACVVVLGGFVAIMALRGRANPRAATAVPTDSDARYRVPLERTAAERMRVAAARAVRVQQLVAERGTATFVHDVLVENDSTVRHWTDRGGASVRVWLQVPIGVTDYRPAFASYVTRAFDEWSRVDGMPVRFEVVGDSANANVVVVWLPLFSGNRIGLTRIEAVNDTIRTGRITIATQREGGVALRDEDIVRCALHEVGHLLGLAHTSDASSIMAPESAQPGLQERDRATVQLLYALPIGSIKTGAIW